MRSASSNSKPILNNSLRRFQTSHKWFGSDSIIWLYASIPENFVPEFHPGEIFEIAPCTFIFGGFTLLGEDPTLKPQRSPERK
jgi:hypothetical protein